VRLTVSSAHGEQHLARRAYLRIAGFMARPCTIEKSQENRAFSNACKSAMWYNF
jgi:hypothetical protein